MPKVTELANGRANPCALPTSPLFPLMALLPLRLRSQTQLTLVPSTCSHLFGVQGLPTPSHNSPLIITIFSHCNVSSQIKPSYLLRIYLDSNLSIQFFP